jgi:ABC-type polysaccharide/polyol phosphate export permease
VGYLRELLSAHELLSNLVLRDVKGKYRNTLLGQLWSLVNPLATMLVYTIVFSLIFRARPSAGDPSGLDFYPLWLLCGLLPWLFFRAVVSGGLSSLTGNAGLIKKVYFPRLVLPFAVTGAAGFTWLIELALLTVALSVLGAFVLPWLPLVLLLSVLLALFATGMGMALAILTVYFRDTQHFVSIALQLWLYLTPIVYPLSLVEEATAGQPFLLWIYTLNPMERFVAVFRQLLYDNRWPDPADALFCLVASLVVFALGLFVFHRFEKRLGMLL